MRKPLHRRPACGGYRKHVSIDKETTAHIVSF